MLSDAPGSAYPSFN